MSARISDAEHRIKGTRPTRSLDHGADIAPGRPKFPKGITQEARTVFKSLCKQLEERRALTAGDVQILHLFAEQHARWVNARAKVAALGEVVTDTRLDSNGIAHEVLRKNPWLTVVETCETKMHAVLRDLGLTPNARSKVKQVGEQKPAEPTPEEQYFNSIGQPSTSAAPALDDFEMPEEIQ